MKKNLIVLIALACFINLNAQNTKPVVKTISPAQKMVEIKTNYGTIVAKLYNETPAHRDNFLSLVKKGFYDSTLFHRVIENFMIQGGDPDSKHADSTQMLGMGSIPDIPMIPAEFRPNLLHKKGALAAARNNNPEKASSNCQFYFVKGRPSNDIEINQYECAARNSDPGFSYTDTQRKIYKTVGGAPFLDQNYTVFGEVIKGLDVIDKITAVAKDGNDRPLKDVIVIKMRILN